MNDGNNQQVGGNAGGAAALNSNVLTGTITITPVNDGPVANNDARSVAEDAAPITGNVIALALAYISSPFKPELELLKAYGSPEEIAAEVSAAYAARVTAEYETLTKE